MVKVSRVIIVMCPCESPSGLLLRATGFCALDESEKCRLQSRCKRWFASLAFLNRRLVFSQPPLHFLRLAWAWSGESARTAISLRFSVLAGAFLVGVAGAKWITSEVDKRLLKESVKVAACGKTLPLDQSEHLIEGTPRQVLQGVKEACVGCQ
jgi:hypothetical protein